nr:hypothetical protein Iba_chr11aCG3370 [Ipomoea batatas]
MEIQNSLRHFSRILSHHLFYGQCLSGNSERNRSRTAHLQPYRRCVDAG